MANNRIFYACQAAAIKQRPYQSSTGTWLTSGADAKVHQCEGLQSIGINTNFNLEQIFELGQLEIYENVEGIPEVEITMEKALDGKRLLYNCCSTAGEKVTQTTQDRADVAVAIYADSGNADSRDTKLSHVLATGMYVSNISYTFPIDGNATESITFVGNAKTWGSGTDHVTNPSGTKNNQSGGAIGAPGGGGVQRREDFNLSGSTIPSTVTNAGKLQSVTVSSDFSREDILELGSKTPYYRAAAFPIEVSCEFEVVATDGDKVAVAEATDNISDESITIISSSTNGTTLNLGSKNKLTSISYGGGDTGGGNATITFSYINYNDLTVTGPTSPAGDTTDGA